MKYIAKFGILLFLFCVLAQAVAPVTLPDIIGAGTTVQIATSGTARWVLFIFTSSTSTHTARIGDFATTSSRGAPVTAGGGLFYPPLPLDQAQPLPGINYYNLNQIYAYIPSGDTLTVEYAQ